MSRKLMVSTLVLASVTAMATALSMGAGCQAEVSATAGGGASTPPPPSSTPPVDTTPPPPPSATASAPPAIKAPKNVQLEGQKVKIPGDIEFDSGKASIRETPASTDVMNTLKEFLDQNPQVTKLQIEGHTDNQPPKDKAMTNQKLSQDRANSVMGWLVAKGIKKDRLVAVGHGDKFPLGPNDNEANRQKNRRTEFHIVELDGKTVGSGSAAAAAAGGGGGGTATAKPSAAASASAAPAASVPKK